MTEAIDKPEQRGAWLGNTEQGKVFASRSNLFEPLIAGSTSQVVTLCSINEKNGSSDLLETLFGLPFGTRTNKLTHQIIYFGSTERFCHPKAYASMVVDLESFVN
jgi:hypothetical protein